MKFLPVVPFDRTMSRRFTHATFFEVIGLSWFILIMLMTLPSGSVAQQEPRALFEVLELQTEGVTIRYPTDWSIAPERLINMRELINVPADEQGTRMATVSVKITTESRIDHAEAIRRLQELGTETGAGSSAFLSIGGHPSLQYRRTEIRPQPSQGSQFTDTMMVRITTAVACGSLLIRLEAALPSDANPKIIGQAEAIGRSLRCTTSADPAQVDQEIEELRRSASESVSSLSAFFEAEALAVEAPASLEEPEPGFTQRVIQGRFGELEIAVSANGRNIVIGQQSLFITSNDGGQTFPFSGFINAFDGGDPSVAFGRSGNFYYAGIDGGCQPTDAAGPFGYTCTGMARSTDNGQTFPLVTPAVVCPNSDPDPTDGITPVASACFPDQEHIAADRVNAAPGGGDQVYSVWRNFDATDADPAIVCSQDSGQTWTAPLNVASGEFPRIAVGQNGFVYVPYFNGNNYLIHKFSSCATGLVPQPGFPRVVTRRIPVWCPFPGHDRCDQNPSSQTVAVDDTNPNHIYYAYAQNRALIIDPPLLPPIVIRSPFRDDIFVRDSLDGGFTWQPERVVRINSEVVTARVMPWVCTTGGEAFVSWYDRRAATPCPTPPCPAPNDVTDYFAGSARLDRDGNLNPGTEFKITEVVDPWCASGWPVGTRNQQDSESCSTQPQLAGFCCNPTTSDLDTCNGSQQRCDF